MKTNLKQCGRQGKRQKRTKKAQRQLAMREWARRERRILRRLDKNGPASVNGSNGLRPVFRGSQARFEMARRQRGTAFGGVALIHQLVREVGLPEAIDGQLHLLRWHKPYHESDHVLNFAYNALCDGDCLEDMELRRTDEAFLDGLGAERAPDPTTAGDFCRRFKESDVRALQDAFDKVRLKVWERQPDKFFAEAVIDMDGTMVETDAEKMQGIDISYNGKWGYHPLVVSLANTGEVLSLINRSGNRPSHEGATEEADRAINLCQKAGFRRIKLRGDTDFTQTQHLDRWDAAGVVFVFGNDATISLQIGADDLPPGSWNRLHRPARYDVQTRRRSKRRKVKDKIVRERQFENTRLKSEEVAEMDYRPAACRKSYRLIIVRKNLEVRDGQGRLFDDYLYFFYLSNDRVASAEQIVFDANQRCNQENLHAQLKGGVCSLTTPVHTLVSNWAYMVMTSLAWNLKAWLALWTQEEKPSPTAIGGKRGSLQQQILRMEFKSFVNELMRLPASVVKTGRQIIVRYLSWTPLQPILFHLLESFRPRRC